MATRGKIEAGKSRGAKARPECRRRTLANLNFLSQQILDGFETGTPA